MNNSYIVLFVLFAKEITYCNSIQNEQNAEITSIGLYILKIAVNNPI